MTIVEGIPGLTSSKVLVCYKGKFSNSEFGIPVADDSKTKFRSTPSVTCFRNIMAAGWKMISGTVGFKGKVEVR